MIDEDVKLQDKTDLEVNRIDFCCAFALSVMICSEPLSGTLNNIWQTRSFDML